MFDDNNIPPTGTPGAGDQQGIDNNQNGQLPANNSPPGEPAAAGDWRVGIVPSEYMEAPALKDIKDAGSLVKQYVDLQKHLGNSIRMPGAEASPEQRQEFLDKIKNHAPELIRQPDPTDEQAMSEFWAAAGVPKEASEYDIDEGLEVNEDWLNNSKALAKKYGLTKGKFREFVKDHLANHQASTEQSEAAQTEDLKSLAGEWGAATEARVNDVKKFAEVMGLPESFRNALESNQVSSEWIKPIWNIITQFGGLKEGSEVAFQPGGSVPDSPAELEAQQAEIHTNPAFLDSRHPQNAALVKKNFELTMKINAARSAN